MVSFHKPLADTPIAEVPAEFEAPPRKRKWGEETLTEEFCKHDPTERKPIFGIELHLDTPLPSHKFQQYLTIQSGQIQLCNTGMSMTKTPDSERNSDPKAPSLGQMSLDLELSLKKKEDGYDMNEKKNHGSTTGSTFGESDDLLVEPNILTRPPSWLSSEGDHREMIATVCMRCHMLVMLCKSSPACPNCKFMHPPDQNHSKFLKRKRVPPSLVLIN